MGGMSKLRQFCTVSDGLGQQAIALHNPFNERNGHLNSDRPRPSSQILFARRCVSMGGGYFASFLMIVGVVLVLVALIEVIVSATRTNRS